MIQSHPGLAKKVQASSFLIILTFALFSCLFSVFQNSATRFFHVLKLLKLPEMSECVTQNFILFPFVLWSWRSLTTPYFQFQLYHYQLYAFVHSVPIIVAVLLATSVLFRFIYFIVQVSQLNSYFWKYSVIACVLYSEPTNQNFSVRCHFAFKALLTVSLAFSSCAYSTFTTISQLFWFSSCGTAP